MQRETASLGLVKGERRRLVRAVRIALFLSAAIPIIAGLIYAQSSYRQASAEARELLGRTAVLAAEHSLRVFEGADSALSEISQLPIDVPSEYEKSLERMTAIVNSRQPVRILGVTDGSGDIKISAPWRNSMNVSWRDYFKAHRDGTVRGSLYVGAPILGSKDTAFSVPVSRAINDAAGTFAGVAFMALDRGYVGQFFERISGPSVEVIGLLSASGALIAEHGNETVGPDRRRTLAVRIEQTRPESIGQAYLDVDDADGESNIVALRAVGDYGLYAFASLRQSAIRAAWWLKAREVLMLLMLPIAGLALAVYLAERQMHSFKDLLAALASNRARYRAIFNSSPDCNFLIGSGAAADALVFLEVNQNTEPIFGLSADGLVGKNVHDVLQSSEVAFISSCFHCCQQSRGIVQREHRVESSSNPGHWEIRIAPLPGQTGTAIGSIRNIAKQKHLTASLRDLTVRLLQRQDQERRQIARDLHDSAAQNLLAASLELKLAADALSQRHGPWHAHLGRMRDFIENTQKEIRGVSYLLHPPMLDESGLPNALHWLVDGFKRRSNIHLELRIGGALNDLRLPGEVETALFRVAQEALANVHRPADASAARLSLDIDEHGMLEFRVEDDGTAARSASGKTVVREGVGISGMRERLIAFDGTLTFRVSNEGAILSAKLRLVPKAA
ncbi:MULTISPECIES: histidine kinase [unclassified Bosea (in: a-proteobacteria)]|uniref:histidine kinase n=1 Tax=unclassified Bosea (in: a-proteobacteria) TaxID=2653178 RepID=UPI000F755E9D|nr:MULTISPECIES: histidine kinase [unclassified Bosea (in: a-proteobacteria)]AZO76457.1 hypothetical protein BLM15_01705 [Bosea sp. Tri-49]RXT26384.1 hypothetical protein B5U98_07620 [Bosea sp. Tri-39]RXT31624.1 hypothetical protein B5U99_23165 [Bosea sp. Tri-54]